MNFLSRQPTVRALLLAGLACGCQGYRSGSLAHPEMASVAVAAVQNDTSEPGLGLFLRARLVEEFSRSGSVRVAPEEDADAVVSVTLSNAAVVPDAHARTRAPVAGEDEDDVYEPVLHRVKLHANVRLEMREASTASGRAFPVTEEAVSDRAPDVAASRSSAMRQAARRVARRIVPAITEAW